MGGSSVLDVLTWPFDLTPDEDYSPAPVAAVDPLDDTEEESAEETTSESTDAADAEAGRRAAVAASTVDDEAMLGVTTMSGIRKKKSSTLG
jgi:hypothetical protein